MAGISVIIPFYNRRAWLIEAIDSVLAQTYTDFEVIVVNNETNEKFNPSEFFNDARIMYIEQENRGAAAARNVGIDRAQGKYIAFLDADDLFVPHKLETQVRRMEENPEIALSHTSYTRVAADGKFVEVINSGQFGGNVYPRIIYSCPIATPTVMVRHEVLNSLRFEEKARVGEDIMLWLKIAKMSKILGIQEPLSKVRIHKENAAFNPEAQLTANIKIIEYAINYDTSLNNLFRLKAISETYLAASALYFELKEKYKAACCVGKAIVCWPINIINIYIYFLIFRIVYLMLPKTLRITLRRIKVSLRST